MRNKARGNAPRILIGNYTSCFTNIQREQGKGAKLAVTKDNANSCSGKPR
jgi:hypothetical protein